MRALGAQVLKSAFRMDRASALQDHPHESKAPAELELGGRDWLREQDLNL